jgi:tetratricopeptide (TPR) repeat protein
MTDYLADLQRIEGDIHAIRCTMLETPNVENVARMYSKNFQYISLTGRISFLRQLDVSLGVSISSSPQPADLWLLKAHVALKRHRFGEAEAALRSDPSLKGFALARLLQSDVDLQQGRYTAAHREIEAVLSIDQTWDALARLAYLKSLIGDVRSADQIYAAAEDELSSKEMQSFAWLLVQRGWMHFQRGNHSEAMAHYDRANVAYSGYWLVEERIAELTGAKGGFAEAIATYQRLYAASPRPEWEHALGNLYSLSGEPQRAQQWKRRAHSSYIQSVASGETYHFHYLADLCCELGGQEREAIEWARRDLANRSNFMTQGDLAWALYRGGESAEAVEWVTMALACGAVSARLYLQAACIYSAAGRADLGNHCMRLAMAFNPRPARAYMPAQHGQPLRMAQTVWSPRIRPGQSVA